MAMFTWPFANSPSALPPGVKAMAVAAVAAILLAAGLGNLQIRAVEAQDISEDQPTLVEFYNATGGDSWTTKTGWLSSAPIQNWHGVSTDAEGRVTSLALDGNNLTGSVPTDLSNLSGLVTLNLQNNSLTGTVPAELGDLSNLDNLYLNSNQLTGQLPYSLSGLSGLQLLRFNDNVGLCAPVDSAFQTWLQGVADTQGDTCAPAPIQSGTTAPVTEEPVTVELPSLETRLARIQATPEEYANNPCIGYDTSGDRAGITVPLWEWERADADSSDPNSPDHSTWEPVSAGRHPNASFVYLPQSGDEGKFLRASVTYGSPERTVTTAITGPVAANNGVTSENIVSVAAPTGALQVGGILSVSLPGAANAERLDPAINPNPERWHWERSDDGSTGWTDVTPYRNCGRPDSEYPLTSDDEGKYLRAYVYYNDDSSGSIVLKRGQSAAVGPVTP